MIVLYLFPYLFITTLILKHIIVYLFSHKSYNVYTFIDHDKIIQDDTYTYLH